MKNYYLLVFIFIVGCVKNNPSFTLKNKTDFIIDKVEIGIKSNTINTINEIAKGSKIKGNIEINENLKGDGSYFVKVYYDSIKIEKNFGYYTNGKSINNNFYIVVKSDTIEVTY